MGELVGRGERTESWQGKGPAACGRDNGSLRGHEAPESEEAETGWAEPEERVCPIMSHGLLDLWTVDTFYSWH